MSDDWKLWIMVMSGIRATGLLSVEIVQLTHGWLRRNG